MSEDTKFKKPDQYKENPNLESEINSELKSELKSELAAHSNEMAGKTNNEILSELSEIEMEEKRLDLEIKREQVAKMRAEKQHKMELAKAKALATLQFLASRKANQDRCNHRKGGRGPNAVMRGEGDDASYAIIKHRLPSREFFCLCQRCGKEWHPMNKWNVENGVLKPLPATEGWDWALQTNTDNTPSASSDFNFQEVKY